MHQDGFLPVDLAGLGEAVDVTLLVEDVDAAEDATDLVGDGPSAFFVDIEHRDLRSGRCQRDGRRPAES